MPLVASWLKGFTKSSDKDAIHIISIQEPPCNEGKNEVKDLETLELHYIKHANVRAAVGAKGTGVTTQFHRNLSNRDLAVTEIRIQGLTSMIFISAYFEPESGRSTVLLEQNIDHLQDALIKLGSNKPIIIASDTNCRSPMWGDTWCQSACKFRAKVLEDFLLLNDLIIRNSFDEPTFSKKNGSSIIDMIITNDHEIFKES